MTKETMTVHQALCEVKVMSKRIHSAIESAEFVTVKDHSAKKVNGVTIDEFTKSAKSSNDKINDLISRYFALKAAINQYNASHSVTIGGKEYTIAEAIWLQSYGIKEKEAFLHEMTYEYNRANGIIENANGDHLTQRAEQFVSNMYGSKDKIDRDEFIQAVEDYKKNNELVIVDPLNIKLVIENLQDEIDAFSSSADAAIQVSNATNTIDIEY